MKTKKRVLHFIDSGGLYGAESVILNLSREMATYNEYLPVVGCIVQDSKMHNDLYDLSLRDGIEARKIIIRNALLWLDLLIAAQTIRRLGISLIHCHGYKAFVLAFLIGKIACVPVISTCHLWFLKGDPPLKMRLMIKLELLLYRFVPITIGVSAPIKDFLAAAGIDEERIKIINNGILVNDYQPADRHSIGRMRAELNLAQDDFVVINVGRLSLQKAQKTILDAARILKGSNAFVRFLIVGDGELRKELDQYIAQHQLTPTVRLLGFRKDIKDLLKIADAFLMTSLDEGMPMSLLEAAASRTPIISTMVGDIPKLIIHGKSGLTVPVNDPAAVADAVLLLAKNADLKQRTTEEAMLRVQLCYSSKYMYEQYRKAYGFVLKNATRHRLG